MLLLSVDLVGLGEAMFVSVVRGDGGWLQWVVLFPRAVTTLERKFASTRH